MKLYYIGGYELMLDGTCSESAKTLDELRQILDTYEINYDPSLLEDISYLETIWNERWDDGGGRGWITGTIKPTTKEHNVK